MRYLNLDKEFNPMKEESIRFDVNMFNGGEVGFRIMEDDLSFQRIILTHRIKNSDDLMLILLAKDALDRMNVKSVSLILPYVPYARQDRVCVSGESLSIKVFTNIINAANFDKVWIFDPHSEVTTALIDRCDVLDITKVLRIVLKETQDDVLIVSPDSGANKKIHKLCSSIGYDREIIKCDKVRDLKTGVLSGFEVISNVDIRGRDLLIVDDICDGGGTFIGLAKELKKKGANKLYLYVSHGIFSNGFKELNKHFEQIFTTNSFKTLEENKKLTIIKL